MSNGILLNKVIFGIFGHITKSLRLFTRPNCTTRPIESNQLTAAKQQQKNIKVQIRWLISF